MPESPNDQHRKMQSISGGHLAATVRAPLATNLSFHDDLLELTLADGRVVGAPMEWFPRLRDASASQLNNWRLIGGEAGIHWSGIDEDISMKSLLAS